MSARMRLVPLVLLASGCNLFVTLDPLSDGGEGGAYESSSSASSSTSDGGGTNAGGDGVGGSGGSGGSAPTSWEHCVASKQPRLHFRMSGSITEPNLGTLESAPEATYFPPHATVPSLLDGDDDGASSFDDPTTEIGDRGEDESGRLELADPGDLDGYGTFSLELWFRMPPSFDAGSLVERATGTGGFRLELQPRIVSDGLDQVTFFFFDDTQTQLTYDERRRQLIRNVDLGGENEVHHVVVIYERDSTTNFDQAGNGDDLRIWVDGTPTTTKACCGPVLLPLIDAPLTIGNGYSGAIDEVVLYDRALTPAEIQKHHAVGRDAVQVCD
jgi:hypothetical protein